MQLQPVGVEQVLGFDPPHLLFHLWLNTAAPPGRGKKVLKIKKSLRSGGFAISITISYKFFVDLIIPGFGFSMTAFFPNALLPPRSTNMGAATKMDE
jgi:hypothetical protein